MGGIRHATMEDLLRGLEGYKFECAGGDLRLCAEWAELMKRLSNMRSSARSRTVTEYMLCEVERFNREVVGLPIPDRVTDLSEKRLEFARGAMHEEIDEFYLADTPAERADALIDLVYYALGRLLEMGFVLRAGFDEVQSANMDKVRGERGREAWSLGHDAAKPPGWRGPDITALCTLTLEDARELMQAKQADSKDKPRDEDVEKRTRDLMRLTFVAKDLKLLVIGHARHGKDTVCEMLRDEYGLTFQSSSMFCAERIMLPYFQKQADEAGQYGALASLGPTAIYTDAKACFDDRGNRRAEWYDQIRNFNRPDATALARAMLEENDVYCGMRSAAELHACKAAGIFDYIIWVDALERLEPEPETSMTLEPWMADFVIDNNGTLDDLRFNVRRLMERLAIESAHDVLGEP